MEAIIQCGSMVFSMRDMKLQGKYHMVVPQLSGKPRIKCKFLLTHIKIFDLATKHTLFPVMGWGLTDKEIDEDHCTYINEILNSGAESFSRHVAKIVSSQAGPFGISSDISPVDIPRFTSFLLMMLQIDQQKQAPTSKLLVHPFMRLRARGNMKKVDWI